MARRDSSCEVVGLLKDLLHVGTRYDFVAEGESRSMSQPGRTVSKFEKETYDQPKYR